MIDDIHEDLIKVGYWYSEREPELPMPKEMSYDRIPEYKQKILDYLKGAEVLHRFRGSSGCRVCPPREDGHQQLNGSKEQSDGVYVWPDGLAHYVEEHNTALPDNFVDHILGFKLHRWGYKRCPRCDAISGDDWGQCEGRCPSDQSPHYDPEWVKGDLTVHRSSNGWAEDHYSHRPVWAGGSVGPLASEPDESDDIPF